MALKPPATNMNTGLVCGGLRELAVWNGDWATPASDSTTAGSVVKHALDPFASLTQASRFSAA